MDILIPLIIPLILFGVGLGLIIFFAEQLVKGVVGTSMGFGLSTFLLIVIFIGAPVVSTCRNGSAGVQCSPPLRWSPMTPMMISISDAIFKVLRGSFIHKTPTLAIRAVPSPDHTA